MEISVKGSTMSKVAPLAIIEVTERKAAGLGESDNVPYNEIEEQKTTK